MKSHLEAPLQGLQVVSDKSFSIAGSVFGLEYIYDGNTIGAVKEFPANSSGPHIRDEQLVNYGILIAYAYSFGLQDLHAENLARTSSRVQVLDAELVLGDLQLPHQTLLLPFHGLRWSECGLSLLFDSLDAIGSDDVALVISGFVAACLELKSRADELSAELWSQIRNGGNPPIRVLLRLSRDYRQLSDFTPPLLVEERIQMAREDVPYFFKFVGDEQLYYYTDTDGGFAPAALGEAHPDLISKIKCVGHAPEALLNAHRIGSIILPTGVLYLAKMLLGGRSATIQLPKAVLSTSKGSVTISGEWGEFKTVAKAGATA